MPARGILARRRGKSHPHGPDASRSVWRPVPNATPKSRSTSSTSIGAISSTCPDCGSILEVTGVSPIELDFAPDDDEDEDLDDEDEDLDDEDGDEDEDEEDEEDEDWDE